MDGGRFFLKKPTEIIKYLLVRLAGILLVNFRIGNLDVEIYQINVRKYLLSKNVVAKIPTCLQDKLNLPSLKGFQKRLKIVGIHSAFATGKSNSAIGVTVKRQVTQYYLHKLFNGIVLPYQP